MTKSKIFAAVLGGSMLFTSAAYAIGCNNVTLAWCQSNPHICSVLGCYGY